MTIPDGEPMILVPCPVGGCDLDDAFGRHWHIDYLDEESDEDSQP